MSLQRKLILLKAMSSEVFTDSIMIKNKRMKVGNDMNSNWLWISDKIYPENQKSFYTLFCEEKDNISFSVAEFKKELKFEKTIKKLEIDVSADTKFWLYVNGEFVGLGPVCHGGDYGFKGRMPYHYYNSYEVSVEGDSLEFYSMVQLIPTVQCDMSCGYGGFIMSAKVIFEDGSSEYVNTDETWLGRLNRQRFAVNKSDFTLKSDRWENVVITVSDRVMKKSPILNLSESEVIPEGFEPVSIESGEMKELCFEFDRIYSGYFHLEIESDSAYTIIIREYEKDYNYLSDETIMGTGNLDFRALGMVSVGGVKVYILNTGKKPVKVNKISLLFNHYPCPENGSFECSDKLLDKIYDVGKWAVNICKQTLELDSPMHQENLGCTGDYMISSLMNYVTYGNSELTRFDIVRTADYLRINDAKMFHTSYSMMWIQMLWDYYMFTGDGKIFPETQEALDMLMERFQGYVGEDGLIDNPPDYMFVDWLIVDDMTLHHPPKALGQGVLTALYDGGLLTAAKIKKETGNKEKARVYKERAEAVKNAFNEKLFDRERGLYFDGLNDEYEPDKWLPQNVKKRYFSWHTNSLAVLYGICDGEKAVNIMEKILNDMTIINPQPYFMHFVMEAINKVGLFEKYGLKQLRRWECMADFGKGLQEGWYAPGDYVFDYSHVWGGTPTYQLPMRISGLEIKKPGFREISLNPRLYDLEYATLKIPTPYGNISIRMKKGENPMIDVPKEITVI